MPDSQPQTQTAARTFAVTEADTAIAVGSGSLPVLGTPRLVAWCEAVTCVALDDLAEPSTSVGTRVEVEHLAPNTIGDEVEVSASITERSERTVVFMVEATHAERVVARGTITRAIVDGERFMARIAARADG